MNSVIQDKTAQRRFDVILRAGVVPSRLSLYPAVIKLEVTEAIPSRWLSSLRIELHDSGLLLACAIRTWDTVGRFYGAYLDPQAGARRSLAPAPDLSRCTSIKLVVEGVARDFPNDLSIFKETGV